MQAQDLGKEFRSVGWQICSQRGNRCSGRNSLSPRSGLTGPTLITTAIFGHFWLVRSIIG